MFEKEAEEWAMDLEFDPLDYILPPPIGTSEKKKSFFKRLWQKLKSLFLRRKLK